MQGQPKQGCSLGPCFTWIPSAHRDIADHHARVRPQGSEQCEFWKEVCSLFSSAGCGREGEQERAYFKPELSDFNDFFEERKDTFCSLPE